jgi:protein-S-isoprenylcysteine O-methyltransferase Ste14
VPLAWQSAAVWVLDACWGVFCLAWLAGALYGMRHAPPVARRGGDPYSLLGGLLVVAALMGLRLLVPASDWEALAYRAPWFGVLGVVVLVGGTAFTLWARVRLGTMWTSAPVLKVGHQLRTDGPYAITRHPIYTGLLAMLLGTVLVGGLGVWLVVLVLGAAIAVLKARAEERILVAEFPEEYAEFRRRVPALVPLPRRSRR